MTELEFFTKRLSDARDDEEEAHKYSIQCEKDLKLSMAGRLTPRMSQKYHNWKSMQPRTSQSGGYLKFAENIAAAAWLLRELEAHELGSKSGHAMIAIAVVDSKVTRIEPGEKILIENMIKCS